MAAVTATQITQAGVAPTYNSASGGGDTFPCGDTTFVRIVNGGGGSITATFTTPGTVSGLAIADLTVTVAAGAQKVTGPFPLSMFGDANGLTAVSWSGTSSVTFAVEKI